jgi:hypothetical protein
MKTIFLDTNKKYPSTTAHRFSKYDSPHTVFISHFPPTESDVWQEIPDDLIEHYLYRTSLFYKTATYGKRHQAYIPLPGCPLYTVDTTGSGSPIHPSENYPNERLHKYNYPTPLQITPENSQEILPKSDHYYTYKRTVSSHKITTVGPPKPKPVPATNETNLCDLCETCNDFHIASNECHYFPTPVIVRTTYKCHYFNKENSNYDSNIN